MQQQDGTIPRHRARCVSCGFQRTTRRVPSAMREHHLPFRQRDLASILERRRRGGGQEAARCKPYSKYAPTFCSAAGMSTWPSRLETCRPALPSEHQITPWEGEAASDNDGLPRLLACNYFFHACHVFLEFWRACRVIRSSTLNAGHGC